MLLFVDNIFRFTQAGAEVSALLGRIPSAVGYQPTLATDMGMLQVRLNESYLDCIGRSFDGLITLLRRGGGGGLLHRDEPRSFRLPDSLISTAFRALT